MQDPVTYDMADFGSREMNMATDLLVAYREQRPDWLGNGVKVAMNRNSGYVFLTDEDYNTAMMNGDKLDMWLFTPYHGHEGFIDDLLSEYTPDDLTRDDVLYLRDMAGVLNADLPKAWQTEDEDAA